MIVIFTAYDELCYPIKENYEKNLIRNWNPDMILNFDEYNVTADDLKESLEFLLKLTKDTYEKM